MKLAVAVANSTKIFYFRRRNFIVIPFFSPSPFPFNPISGRRRIMVTSAAGGGTGSGASSSRGAGAYTSISERVIVEREIKKSKFIAIAGPVSSEQSAHTFLSQVRDDRATHNCWAYKIGDQYRSNDDGEPSGTAGKPIYSAIESSGIDRVMIVVIRHFGGIKLGTGGLVRAYGGVAVECLKNAPTCLVKSQVPMGVEISYDLLGVLYHQLQSFKAEDIKQDYELVKMVPPWSLSKLILIKLRVWKMLLSPLVAEVFISTRTDITEAIKT